MMNFTEESLKRKWYKFVCKEDEYVPSVAVEHSGKSSYLWGLKSAMVLIWNWKKKRFQSYWCSDCYKIVKKHVGFDGFADNHYKIRGYFRIQPNAWHGSSVRYDFIGGVTGCALFRKSSNLWKRFRQGLADGKSRGEHEKLMKQIRSEIEADQVKFIARISCLDCGTKIKDFPFGKLKYCERCSAIRRRESVRKSMQRKRFEVVAGSLLRLGSNE